MPDQPLWLKKVFGWLKVALFTLDTGSDIYVGIDLINRCHDKYAGAVLSIFSLPGFLSGGYFAASRQVRYFLKEKFFRYDVGNCGIVILILLGTIFGPLVFLPVGLFLLVKAAIDPDNSENVGTAKV